jgi:hypothetical protein
MTTLDRKVTRPVRAVGARFVDSVLYVSLSDKREIGVPLKQATWLRWLANATPEQRANWSIEPQGFAVYWDDLDDGIEVEHLLSMQPIA